MPDKGATAQAAWWCQVGKPALQFARADHHFVEKSPFYDDARAELAIWVACASQKHDFEAHHTNWKTNTGTRLGDLHVPAVIL